MHSKYIQPGSSKGASFPPSLPFSRSLPRLKSMHNKLCLHCECLGKGEKNCMDLHGPAGLLCKCPCAYQPPSITVVVVIHAILSNLHERIAKHGTPVINHPSGNIRAYVKTNTFAAVWRCVKLISGFCLWLTLRVSPAKPAVNPLYMTTQSTKSGISGICHCCHFKAFKNCCFNRVHKIPSKTYWEHHLLSESGMNMLVW